MGTVHQLVVGKAEPGEQRTAPRRRVLMRAAMRVRGNAAVYPLTVRDISSTGVKAVAEVKLFQGTMVEVDLPNLGWIPGEVVWSTGDRGVGIRFDAVIEPERTQKQVTGSYAVAPPPPKPSLRRL